jgi:hypothetical protein
MKENSSQNFFYDVFGLYNDENRASLKHLFPLVKAFR